MRDDGGATERRTDLVKATHLTMGLREVECV